MQMRLQALVDDVMRGGAPGWRRGAPRPLGFQFPSAGGQRWAGRSAVPLAWISTVPLGFYWVLAVAYILPF